MNMRLFIFSIVVVLVNSQLVQASTGSDKIDYVDISAACAKAARILNVGAGLKRSDKIAIEVSFKSNSDRARAKKLLKQWRKPVDSYFENHGNSLYFFNGGVEREAMQIVSTHPLRILLQRRNEVTIDPDHFFQSLNQSSRKKSANLLDLIFDSRAYAEDQNGDLDHVLEVMAAATHSSLGNMEAMTFYDKLKALRIEGSSFRCLDNDQVKISSPSNCVGCVIETEGNNADGKAFVKDDSGKDFMVQGSTIVACRSRNECNAETDTEYNSAAFANAKKAIQDDIDKGVVDIKNLANPAVLPTLGWVRISGGNLQNANGTFRVGETCVCSTMMDERYRHYGGESEKPTFNGIVGMNATGQRVIYKCEMGSSNTAGTECPDGVEFEVGAKESIDPNHARARFFFIKGSAGARSGAELNKISDRVNTVNRSQTVEAKSKFQHKMDMRGLALEAVSFKSCCKDVSCKLKLANKGINLEENKAGTKKVTR